MKIINKSTKLAHEGGVEPLTTTPIVGTPQRIFEPTFKPGVEELESDEIRVTILGSGDPFVKKAQASASVLLEVGNDERDLFFFDLGSGSLANFNGLELPVTSTNKVFLTHLHADHIGDMPTLIWSLAKSGRRDPVEVWGPASDNPKYGTLAYTTHLEAAHAWDSQSLNGHPGQSGAHIITTEVPYDKLAVIYERNGVKISSFPVLHIQNGSVGYRLDFNGKSVVFSGDTRPCKSLVDASENVDLLIHETFPSAKVFAKKAGVSIEQAEAVVNGVHTSPAMAGKVFKKVGAKMSVMWHLALDHETVESVFEEMKEQYDGPASIAQDLTVFNITNDAVVVRQAQINPSAWPVLGKTIISGPPQSKINTPPDWWSELLFKE